MARRLMSSKASKTSNVASEDAGEVRIPRSKRQCSFCEGQKAEPTFTDSATLRKFISDRSRIIPRIRTGVCSKHHRGLTRQIKYARHLSLLPFVTRAY